MPYYVRCVEEETWLTESRPITTWKALEMLAQQLTPSNNPLLLPLRKTLYSREDTIAWTNLFFKVRDYKPPPPPINLKEFYTPLGLLDLDRLAKALNKSLEETALWAKTLDKTLMMAAAEEMLQAVRHSHQFNHVVQLVKART